MACVVGVHGIHDDGDRSVDALCGHVARAIGGGWFREIELPRRWAISCYLPSVNRNDARSLARQAPDGAHVIAHSRGALLVMLAMTEGKRFGTVILFGPALPADARFPKGKADHIQVIFNRADKALLASRLLPYHPFTGGRPFAVARHSLGRTGWSGVIPEGCTQIDATDDSTWLDHSNWAQSRASDRWIAHCAHLIKTQEAIKAARSSRV